MARCDEKHLIMAPKIHGPGIVLHSRGKKSKRGPRTETFQVSPPHRPVSVRGKFHHVLTRSQALKTQKHVHRPSASGVGTISCPTTDWKLGFRRHLDLAEDGHRGQLSGTQTIMGARALMSNNTLKMHPMPVQSTFHCTVHLLLPSHARGSHGYYFCFKDEETKTLEG